MPIELLIFYFLVIIPSAIFHEVAHGWMAERLGDPTARYAGRLTLNPLAHIDPFGTILLPLIMLMLPGNFLFAYAKPVPYNPYNLKNQKWGPALVGLAGPAANFLLAVTFALIIRAIPVGSVNPALINYLAVIVLGNILLMVFNMVPIPPLDGSKILFAILPDSAYKLRATLERYGFVILLFFILFLFRIISPIIDFIFKFLVG